MDDISFRQILDRLGYSWQGYAKVRTEKFQIILLRNNLLTYYREGRRTPAFLTVLDSLDDGGFFIIGSHEKLPCQNHTLLPFKGCSYILQKT